MPAGVFVAQLHLYMLCSSCEHCCQPIDWVSRAKTVLLPLPPLLLVLAHGLLACRSMGEFIELSSLHLLRSAACSC